MQFAEVNPVLRKDQVSLPEKLLVARRTTLPSSKAPSLVAYLPPSRNRCGFQRADSRLGHIRPIKHRLFHDRRVYHS